MPSPPITPLPQTARPPSYPVLTSPPLLHHPPLLARTSLSLPPTSFIFSASPLLFHPGSSRIALVHDTASDSYFLPRGRKDVGESLATCALREGFEESGFRGELISWGGGPSGTLQPKPPGSSKGTDQLQMDNKEAFWAQAQPIHTYRGVIIYFTYYFLAILPEDNPIPDKGKERLVGAHESGYVGILVPVEEAIKLLSRNNECEGNSLVFVADQDKMLELFRSGKIWKEGLGENEADYNVYAASERDDARDGKKDVWMSGPIRASDAFRIDKDTADRLAREGKGKIIPRPNNGSDDGVVQARVVYEGWKRLKEIHGWN